MGHSYTGFLSIAGALLLLVSCQPAEDDRGTGATHDDSNPLHNTVIPMPESAIPIRMVERSRVNQQFQYMGEYRGAFSGQEAIQFWFARLDHTPIRIRFQLLGKAGDRMFVHAIDRGKKGLECIIEDVEDRIGCPVKAETTGRVFLVTVEKSKTASTGDQFELYISTETENPLRFFTGEDVD